MGQAKCPPVGIRRTMHRLLSGVLFTCEKIKRSEPTCKVANLKSDIRQSAAECLCDPVCVLE
jgi:hypothetical protein